ncbi:Fic family protein [Nocardia lasii]|uniref:Fic family protein n=1 Tax=Nocardia lasii TaxID=1616107 RepID=A0ABW1JSW8_9NOCA
MLVRDDLRAWLAVRAAVPWAEIGESIVEPVVGRRDGVVSYVDGAGWDSPRTDRLRVALAAARAAPDLTLDRLADWHRIAMGARRAQSFRTVPAFAKGGRERYGVDAGTSAEFENHLLEAADPAVALAARAARVYSDVCFFHPFSDGNARAAMLAIYHVLARGGVVLDQAGPVLAVSRRADDHAAALVLVRLVDVLIDATRARCRGGPTTNDQDRRSSAHAGYSSSSTSIRR